MRLMLGMVDLVDQNQASWARADEHD